MQLLPLPLLLTLAACQEDQHQRLLNGEDYIVPGSNPFTYCTNPKPYILQISELSFTLSAPKKSSLPFCHPHLTKLTLPHSSTRNLSLSPDTHLIQTIERGAQVHVQMGMMLNGSVVPIDDQKLDLGEELERDWGVECPVKSGVETRERNITLYGGVEGVEYVVVLDAWTKNEDRIPCLQGKLGF